MKKQHNKNEKTYNIKKLYVGYIAIQSQVHEEWIGKHYALEEATSYTWTYKPLKLGMFIKTQRGYKHILTDTYYKKANYKTGGEIVIVEKNTTKLTQYDLSLTEKLVANNITHINRAQIKLLEERYTKIFENQMSKQEGLEDIETRG